MSEYKLFVYCRRSGVSQDAGLHSQVESDNETQALNKLRQDARWLTQFYDQVFCTIHKDGQEFTRYTL